MINTAEEPREIPPGTENMNDGAAGDISVVVCTLAKNLQELSSCLSSLNRQTKHFGELILVSRAEIPNYLNGLASMVVVEPKRGLSLARNVGVSRCSGNIIGFTDDDCICSETWIEKLLEGFSDPNVWMVTGRTLARNGSKKRFSAAVMDNPFRTYFKLDRDRIVGIRGQVSKSMLPTETWNIGNGNNMAIRRSALERVGPFDEQLGPGSRSRSAEDLDMFLRVLLHGGAIMYEPSALSYHEKLSYSGWFMRQCFGYRLGEGAILKKYGSVRLSNTAARILVDRSLEFYLRFMRSAARLRVRQACQSATSLASLHAGFIVYRRHENPGVLRGDDRGRKSRQST